MCQGMGGRGANTREMWQNTVTSKLWYSLMAGTSEQLGADGRSSLTWVVILQVWGDLLC